MRGALVGLYSILYKAWQEMYCRQAGWLNNLCQRFRRVLQELRTDQRLCHAAGRKLLQFQGASIYSLLNSGQLNSAAVQQLAQAFAGSATNLAGVTQINAAGTAPLNCTAADHDLL